jgi:hypothetical protein
MISNFKSDSIGYVRFERSELPHMRTKLDRNLARSERAMRSLRESIDNTDRAQQRDARTGDGASTAQTAELAPSLRGASAVPAWPLSVAGLRLLLAISAGPQARDAIGADTMPRRSQGWKIIERHRYGTERTHLFGPHMN